MEGPLFPHGTRLIETFGRDATGFPRLEAHLARMAGSACALGFRFDRPAIERALSDVPDTPGLRVRLTTGEAGDAEVTWAPLTTMHTPLRVRFSDTRLSSADPRLRHKTTQRQLYDRIRVGMGGETDEVFFLNERDEICEGTITNLFFDLGEGLCTPPLSCFFLSCGLRAELLASGQCRAAGLRSADLPRARLWAGNALRGLMATDHPG